MDASKFTTKQENPRQRANILSVLFFCWTLPTLKKGYKKKITEEDLFKTLKEHHSSHLGDELEREWQKELQKNDPSLWKALLKLFLLDFVMLGFVYLFNEFLKIAQIIALGNLILYYSSKSGISAQDAYLNAGAIAGINFLNTIILQNYFMGMQHIGMKMRVACSSLIYRKVLKLSQQSLKDTTTGQLVNLISNDVSRFDIGVVHLHGMMVAPIVVAVAMYLTYSIVGAIACVGIAVFITFIPLQMYVAKRISDFRLNTALKTDERVRLMNEIIKGIKVIKMYTWEPLFMKLVATARKLEIKEIGGASYLRALMLSFQIFTTRFAIFLVIVTSVLLNNNPTAHYVFFVISFYNTLKVIMTIHVPTGMYEGAEVYVSIGRIRDLLLYEEIDDFNSKNRESFKDNFSSGINIKDASARWNMFSTTDTLSNINLSVKSGELLAIVGPVGSGKSSLLQLILKEFPITEGTCKVAGKISYAPQEPWIFRGTIRQNILFGQPMEERRYQEVVKVCSLEADFSLFPYGDKTLVGERGTRLSGGQKARINLARVVYRNAEIYLLDDPLSAVDVQVGKELFQNCIKEFLKNRIVILVTHQLQYLNNVDCITVLDNGHISMKGTYEELKDRLDFGSLVAQKEVVDVPEDATVQEKEEEATDEKEDENEAKEEIKSGGVSYKVHVWYMRSAGGFCLAFCIFILFLLSQVVASGGDYFITFWVNLEQMRHHNGDFENRMMRSLEDILTPKICIYIYSGIIGFLIVETLICLYAFFKFCLRASTKIHKEAFSKIVYAPMELFTANSSGTILNRFSDDMGAIDEILPVTISDTIQIGLAVLGTITITAVVNYWLLIPTFVIALICLPLRKFYMATSRNVKRLEATTRSPIFSHINATLQGLTTIRAFQVEDTLKDEFDNYQDVHSSAYFIFMACTRVFSLWIDIVLSMFVTIVTFSFFLLDEESFAGNVGLAITQALSLTGAVQWGMRQWTEFENQLISLERISEYRIIKPEAKANEREASYYWPKQGKIEFSNVCLKYSFGENYVLNNVNFEIKPKEKIGVVGRTGAGKSSLITALFRLHETYGTILVDGLNISKLNLRSIRSKISIIPQEPILFSETLRKNLDPFDRYPDDFIWNALEDVELKDKIANSPRGLFTKVSEDGSNFSVGQRQLLCLARAILRRNRILVLDEATANVDHATDKLIQLTIKKKFQDCTVLTIAHRLNTIMDSDRVLVMNNGAVVEFDKPGVLLENSNSMFYSLVEQSNNMTS